MSSLPPVLRMLLFSILTYLLMTPAVSANSPLVFYQRDHENDFPLFEAGAATTIVYDAADAKVVEIAAGFFASDLQRVTGVAPSITNGLPSAVGAIVLIGTLGRSPLLDGLVSEGKLDASQIRGGWERYQIQVLERPFPNVSQALVIAGSDRRGTAFGVFTLSEAMGVSPWYWWADVPPATKRSLREIRPIHFRRAQRPISRHLH